MIFFSNPLLKVGHLYLVLPLFEPEGLEPFLEGDTLSSLFLQGWGQLGEGMVVPAFFFLQEA